MIVLVHLVYLGAVLWLYMGKKSLVGQLNYIKTLPPVTKIVEKVTIVPAPPAPPAPAPPIRAPEIPPDFCVNVNDGYYIMQHGFQPLPDATVPAPAVEAIRETAKVLPAPELGVAVAFLCSMLVMVFLYLVFYDLRFSVQDRGTIIALEQDLADTQEREDLLQAALNAVDDGDVSTFSAERQQALGRQLAEMTTERDRHMATTITLSGRIDHILEDLQAILSNSALERDNTRLGHENAELNTSNIQLQQQNTQLLAEKQRLQDENAALDTQIHTLNQQNQDLRAQQQNMNDQIQGHGAGSDTQTANLQPLSDTSAQTDDRSHIDANRSSDQVPTSGSTPNIPAIEIQPESTSIQNFGADRNSRSSPPASGRAAARLSAISASSDPRSEGASSNDSVQTAIRRGDGAGSGSNTTTQGSTAVIQHGAVNTQDNAQFSGTAEQHDEEVDEAHDNQPAPRDDHSDSDDDSNNQPPSGARGVAATSGIAELEDLESPRSTGSRHREQSGSSDTQTTGNPADVAGQDHTNTVNNQRSNESSSTTSTTRYGPPVASIRDISRSSVSSSTSTGRRTPPESMGNNNLRDASRSGSVSNAGNGLNPNAQSFTTRPRVAGVNTTIAQNQSSITPNISSSVGSVSSPVAHFPEGFPKQDDYEITIPKFITEVGDVPNSFSISSSAESPVLQYNRHLASTYNTDRNSHETTRGLQPTRVAWDLAPGASIGSQERVLCIWPNADSPNHRLFTEYLFQPPTGPKAMRNSRGRNTPTRSIFSNDQRRGSRGNQQPGQRSSRSGPSTGTFSARNSISGSRQGSNSSTPAQASSQSNSPSTPVQNTDENSSSNFSPNGGSYKANIPRSPKSFPS